MTATNVSVIEQPQLSRVAVRAILIGLLTGVFMSALDGMIMATAMRTVADSLHGLTAQAWVSTGYLMTMTISAPLYGKLCGIFGTAVFLSLMFNLATGRIAGAFRSASATPEFDAATRDPAVVADPEDQGVLEGLRTGTSGIDLNDTSALNGLDARLARPILEGLSSAMSTVFLIIAALVAAAALLALYVRKSRSTTAAQQ